MLMAIIFGALVRFTAPTHLVWTPIGAPVALRLTLLVMAIAVLGSGIQDAAAALRLRKLSSRTTSGPPDKSTRSHWVPNVAAERGEPIELPSRAGANVLKIPSWMCQLLTPRPCGWRR